MAIDFSSLFGAVNVFFVHKEKRLGGIRTARCGTVARNGAFDD